LTIEPENIEALLNKSQGLLILNEFEESVFIADIILTIESKNLDALR